MIQECDEHQHLNITEEDGGFAELHKKGDWSQQYSDENVLINVKCYQMLCTEFVCILCVNVHNFISNVHMPDVMLIFKC